MNAIPVTVPSLRSLFWRDLVIQRTISMVIGGMIFTAGVLWATAPATNPPPGVDLSFELAAALWAPVIGGSVALLGAIILTRRYLRVKKTLTEGVIIEGMVVDLEVHSSTSTSNSSGTSKATKRYSYYATVRYAVHGVEREARLRLPNSGFTYGLAEGRETDLLVLESAPKKPLIRSVYLGKK